MVGIWRNSKWPTASLFFANVFYLGGYAISYVGKVYAIIQPSYHSVHVLHRPDNNDIPFRPCNNWSFHPYPLEELHNGLVLCFMQPEISHYPNFHPLRHVQLASNPKALGKLLHFSEHLHFFIHRLESFNKYYEGSSMGRLRKRKPPEMGLEILGEEKLKGLLWRADVDRKMTKSSLWK